ncbi:WD40 repeat domain-containing protein [Thermoproteota archaeon]
MQIIMRIRHKKRRRGIGNVIASMIFIFLVIFMTGNLMVWSILQFSDYQNVVQDMNSYDMLSIGESVDIFSAKLNSSDFLDITVSNNGRSTAHIVSLWIINESSSDPSAKHYHFSQNKYLTSGQSISGIGSSIQLDSTMRYTFRIITELGNIASYQIIPVSEAILKLDTTINPPTIISEHDIFVHMIVTNNLSFSGAVYNLQPILVGYKVINQTATVNCGDPSPLFLDVLPSSATAIFDWPCTIEGTAGTEIQFNTSYVGAPNDYWSSDTALIVTGLGRVLNISGIQGSATFSPANLSLISFTSPILSYTAVGSDDDNVYFIDSTGGLIWQKNIGSDVNSVAMSAKFDGSDFFIVAGNDDNDVYLWNKTGHEIWKYLGSGTSDILSVAISANGSYVVAGGQDNYVYYFKGDGGNGNPLWSYDTANNVNSVDISDDGDKVVAGGDGANVYLWINAKTTHNRFFYDTHNHVNSVDITGDGDFIVAGDFIVGGPGGSYNDEVFYFDSSTFPILKWSVDINDNIDEIKISEDGKYVLAGGTDLHLLEDSVGNLIWEYNADGNVNSVFMSSDGYYIVVGDDQQIRFFIRTSGLPLWSFKNSGAGDSMNINSVFVSDDGNTVVAGGNDNDIRVWKRAKELTGLASNNNEGPVPSFTYSTGDNVNSVVFNSLVNPTVTLNNSITVTGDVPLFVVLTAQSRLILFNSTTQNLYTGALAQSTDESGDIWHITVTRDSGPVFPNQIIVLSFNIPADVKSEVPSGEYAAYVRLVGYDEKGESLTQTIYLGNVTF